MSSSVLSFGCGGRCNLWDDANSTPPDGTRTGDGIYAASLALFGACNELGLSFLCLSPLFGQSDLSEWVHGSSSRMRRAMTTAVPPAQAAFMMKNTTLWVRTVELTCWSSSL